MAKPFPQGYIDSFPTFNWKDFLVLPNVKNFDQEASALGIPAGKVPSSIAIIGKKGKVAFYLDYSLTTDMSFTYLPFQDYIDQYPELKGWSVTIWND